MDSNNSNPDTSINHTSVVNEYKIKRRLSIFSIIVIVILACVGIFFLSKILIKKSDLNLSKEVFLLSDNSTLIFLDDDDYILKYSFRNETIDMKGKYKISYDNAINENVRFEYKTYIDEFKKDDYTLGFLELQNDVLYVNGRKSENGYINMYYIMMVYYEDKNLNFLGYNVDTGVRIKFEKQKGKFSEYYDRNKDMIDDEGM